MEIKVYFVKNENQWSDEVESRMLSLLPSSLYEKITAYKNWQDRQSRILSKWLLAKMLDHFHINHSLNDLKYTSFHKPYFDGDFDFSIAHSGDMVICAGIMNGNIGIDVERMSDIDLPDYQDHLTAQEWDHIHHSAEPTLAFYQIWTKKEALLKAIGRGIDIDFDQLDVTEDGTEHSGQKYAFHPLMMPDGYVAHLATSAPSGSASVSSEMLSAPL